MLNPKLDPRLLLLLVLCVRLTAARPANRDVADCNGFEFRSSFTKASDQESFTLVLDASGGRAPYHYLLLDSKNNLVSKDFSVHVFSGIKRDRYRCIVSDNNDCTKEQFIEVK